MATFYLHTKIYGEFSKEEYTWNHIDISDNITELSNVECRYNSNGCRVVAEINFSCTAQLYKDDVVTINLDNTIFIGIINSKKYDYENKIWNFTAIEYINKLNEWLFVDQGEGYDFLFDGYIAQYQQYDHSPMYSYVHKWKYVNNNSQPMIGYNSSFRMICLIQWLFYKLGNHIDYRFNIDRVIFDFPMTTRTHIDGEWCHHPDGGNANSINCIIGAEIGSVYVVPNRMVDNDDLTSTRCQYSGQTKWANNILPEDKVSVLSILNNILAVMNLHFYIKGNFTDNDWTIHIDFKDLMNVGEFKGIDPNNITSCDVESIAGISHASFETSYDYWSPNKKSLKYVYPDRAYSQDVSLPGYFFDCATWDGYNSYQYYTEPELSDTTDIKYLRFGVGISINLTQRPWPLSHGHFSSAGGDFTNRYTYICMTTWTDMETYLPWTTQDSGYVDVLHVTGYYAAYVGDLGLPTLSSVGWSAGDEKSIIVHGTKWTSPGYKINWWYYSIWNLMKNKCINCIIWRPLYGSQQYILKNYNIPNEQTKVVSCDLDGAISSFDNDSWSINFEDRTITYEFIRRV